MNTPIQSQEQFDLQTIQQLRKRNEQLAIENQELRAQIRELRGDDFCSNCGKDEIIRNVDNELECQYCGTIFLD